MGLISFSLNSEFAPKFIRLINSFYVLWFEKSNKYLLLDENNMAIVNTYIHSSSKTDFYNSLDTSYQSKSAKLLEEVHELLERCNTAQQKDIFDQTKLPTKTNWITHTYRFSEITFRINYVNEKVKALIHSTFAHLEVLKNLDNLAEFHLDLDKDQLWLFKDHILSGVFPKSDYHLLQGKFAMELLCLITNTSEDSWMGTFHASTISNDHEAIMLVGESGKGKSTLSALLMTNGFNLMADDFTPIFAESQLVYNYPSAISIKEGAFDVLKTYFENSSDNKIIQSNSSKGQIKFLPPINKKSHKPLPCNKIVLVNYIKNASTVLEESPMETVLNTLIPDSWLSPNQENAEHFLNWLEKLSFYKLTYSDNTEVINVFKKLFNNH